MFSSLVPGQRAPDRRGLQVRDHLHVERQLDARRRTAGRFRDQLAHREPVVLPEREGRHRALHRVELEVQVARDHQRDEDRGRALLADALPRAVGRRRVARHVVVAVEEDRLPLQILTRQIGVGGQTDVDRFEIEAAGWCGDTAMGRLRAAERHALAAARRGDAPGLRHPLRRQIERLLADVGEPERLQLGHQPAAVLGIGFAADDSSPELRMAVVAIAPRHRGQLLDVGLQMRAVDRGIRIGRAQRQHQARHSRDDRHDRSSHDRLLTALFG